jgi:hypothetical protein
MLCAVALTSPQRLHAFLSARAGHSVTLGYVERVHVRAVWAGAIAFAIFVCTWLGLPRLAAACRETWPPPGPVGATLIAIGAFIRALLLGGPPHYDEAFTLSEFASRSPLFFLTRYTHSNNHVFHTLAVWVVRCVAGDRLWALRLPAFAAGVALLFVVYVLGRRWHDEATACLGVALAAVASPLVEYSAQARGYTILTLTFLLLFAVNDDRLRALFTAVGAWTIPTMLYAAAGWALSLAVTQRAWRRIAFVTLTGGSFTFFLYLPILLITGPESITSNGNTLSVPYAVLFAELPRTFLDLASDWSLAFTLPIAVLLALAAIIAVVRRTPSGIALAASLAAIVVLLLVLRKVPFPRVWIFVLPLFLIAAASTITRTLQIPAPLLIVVTLVFATNAVRVTGREGYVEDPAMRDTSRVAAVIRALPAEARVLVTSPLDAPYAFFVPGPRIVQDRFDSDPAAVRSAMLAAPRRFAVVSTRAGGDAMLKALALPFRPIPVARFPHSILVELLSPQ